MAFFTASYQQLLWIPNSSGALRALSAWRGFPYHISSLLLPTIWLLVLTELYNSVHSIAHSILGMACLIVNQAEITLMQFTGHSLPVHQSMSVPWDFFYLVPISSTKSRLRDFSITGHLGCVSSFWCITFGMAYLPRTKVKIQHAEY